MTCVRYNCRVMTETGILIHVYHLGANNWEQLVWGEPDKDLMGPLPTLVKLLLIDQTYKSLPSIILYTGPRGENELLLGGITKQLLIKNFDKLHEFAQLRPLLNQLTEDNKQEITSLIKQITIGIPLNNTEDEITQAAKHFEELGVRNVIQIAVSSHAPRCIQMQSKARRAGIIPNDQLWSVIASDTTFNKTSPTDVTIIEPPHRGDDPLLNVHPSISEVTKQYFSLTPKNKLAFIKYTETFMDKVSSSK
jgi:hypothetical protein